MWKSTISKKMEKFLFLSNPVEKASFIEKTGSLWYKKIGLF
jgi:hypothetical protein